MIKKALITFFVIMIINFFLPRMMPGDPFDFLSVEDGITTITLTEDQIMHYRSYYGMDQPLWKQFIDYVKNVITGDFGRSIYYNQSVTHMVLDRIIWTLAMVIISMIISSVLGTTLGMISAYLKKEGHWIDGILVRMMTVLSEIPDFILGLFMLFLFAAKLNWFPLSGGMIPFAEHQTLKDWLFDYLHHAALPVLVLALSSIGDFFLLGRQSTIAILREPYIQTAHAKGLRKKTILLRHVFINACSPILARIFARMGMLVGGAVLVENVFAYPGVGRLMREAVGLRDYIMIQGIFFYVAVCVLIFHMIADIIYKRMNKREV